MRHSIKKFTVTLLSSATAIILVPSMCSAWAGFKPSSGSGSGSGSYDPTDCSGVLTSVRSNDCNGVSWVYYRFTGTTEKKEITFKPGYSQTISGDCAQDGTGFWHLGYNATFNDYHDPLTGNLLTDEAKEGWTAADGGNIQVGDVSGSRLNNGATFYMMPFNGSNDITTHVLKYGNENYYTSAYYGDDDTVKAAYEALPDSDKKDEDGNVIGWRPNDLYAFCSPDPEAKTTFTGSSSAKIDGTSVSHGNSVEIHNDTGNVVFSHNITRGNNGSSSAKKAKYYVNSIGSGQDIGSDSDWRYTEGLAKTATSSAIVTAGKNVSVDPGGSTWVWSRLWFYKTLKGTSYTDKGSPSYSANSNCGNTAGRYCIGLTRPYATFTGSVTATVKKNSAKTNVTIPANHQILLVDSDDGYYEISFSNTVKRNSDNAGGSVKTQYSASRREASTGGVSTATWFPSGATSSGDTNALAMNGSQNVFAPKVSGTLKYGETRTFCSSMSYRAKQKTNNAMTAATGSEYCITITRPKAKCAINSAFEYGVKDGRNVGSIGVRNYNNASKNSFSWTPVNTFTSHQLAYNDTNAWAMPGDDIQFKYGACAGAYYAIEQSGLTGMGTHYSTAGWLVTNALGTDGTIAGVGTRTFGTSSNGYLFKNEANKYRNYSAYTNPVNKNNADLAAITATTPLPYATWTTGYNGASKPTSGFLSKPSEPVAEMYGDTDTAERAHSAKSPSTNGYGGTTANTYKVCKTATGCMFGNQNVGSIIVQQLTWNYLDIQNAAIASGPTQHSATSIVRIPYNYYLRPFVTNNDSSGVVYLGENKTMYPGVVVYPRTNSLVHGGATYATVTKETHINVRVYNQRTNRDLIPAKSIVKRLNQNGNISTEAGKDASFLPDGKVDFGVLDDGYNAVGDRVCVELKIWPIDSHETGNSSTVYGASRNSNNVTWDTQYALMEGYLETNGNPRYSATATSCSTVAKRPTTSVESSNAYSATSGSAGFTAGHYAKQLGSTTATATKYIFGSWSEYGVFGEINKNKIFASGAALGYKTNSSGNTVVNASRSNDSPSTTASGSASGKICTFTTQTFVNLVGTECNTASNAIGSESANSYRNNMLERYSNVGQDSKSSHVKVTAKVGGYYNLDITSDKIEDYRIEKGNDKSIVALYADGNAVLSSVPKFTTNTNRTIVYRVKGTLVIKGSAINDERGVAKTELSEVAGIVIIADKVWIDASVNYINAAIITTDATNAEINTCKYANGTEIKIGTGNDSAAARGTLSSAVCNNALVFDGPVFTKRIIMNRTAGADAGASSIKRAEIFNLNMANYLWSFDQMTHYSQAVTTYSRELPTRY